MPKKLLSVLTAALMVVSFSSCMDEAPLMPEPKKTTVQLQKPEAGENFYGYVNFDYLTEGQIPYGKTSYGTFESIQDSLEKDVSDIIDKCLSSEPESGSFEEKIKEMYNQYLDYDKRDKDGADLLLAPVKMIEDCKTTDELVKVLGYVFQEYGSSSFFVFQVDPDGDDASVSRLQLMNMNTCGNMKENFTKTDRGIEKIGDLAKDVFVCLEVDAAQVKERTANVCKMINDIAYATEDSDKRLDFGLHYNLRNRSEFAKIYSNVNVDDLLISFGIGEAVDKLNVYELHQSEKINEYFTDEHLRELKDYAVMCLLSDYASELPPSFTNSSDQSIEKDSEKTAKKYVAALLENEVGTLYGRQICTDKTMQAAEKMTSDLKESCRSLIKNCDRIGDDTRKKYLSKLDNMLFLIGYNKNYGSAFEIVPAKDGGGLLANVIAIRKSEAWMELRKLAHETNRETWDMSAVTVNAVYNPMVNTVTIPAAMLSKASFNAEWSEYKNLGRLGQVIGHEMNHAFDSSGYKFDEIGSFKPDWISKTDKENYNKLMDRVREYYSKYTVLDVYHIDGSLTLGENIADMGSVQCLLNIAKTEEQKKEILQAQAEQWASLVLVTDVVMQMEGDEHSPAEARVNAVVSCTDAFYETYDIKETDKMYVPPEDRIKVW